MPFAHVRGVIGCGHYHQPPGTQPGGPVLYAGREKVELLTAGRAWVIVDGAEVEVGPGCLLWHQPGDRMISRSCIDQPFSCLSLTWHTDPPCRQVPRITLWPDPAEVLAFTRQLVRAYSDDRIDRRTLALSSYAQLHWRAHLHAATATTAVLPVPLATAIEALERNPQQNWSVEEIADLAGCRPSRLHGLFRTHLDTTPHQHLLDLRLRRARELLATGDGDLGSVAVASGLGSAAALCRLFRREMGMTPGEYRARQQ